MNAPAHVGSTPMLTSIQLQLENLNDQLWRLNNLYWIVNDNGVRVPFRLRPIQEAFLRDMWYRNVILKSRQHGFTTLIDIWTLDCCLFVPEQVTAIIAQTQKDAQRIFESKVEYPYKNLPQGLLDQFPVERANMQEMKFKHNGSKIEVTMSGRGTTTHILHVSEYGKISKEDPIKAKEIRTGAFATSHAGSYIFVESTAEGTEGEFYNLTQTAIQTQQENLRLTPLTFKFHFYPWHEKPGNRLSQEDADYVRISARLQKYFQELEAFWSIRLSARQRAWYAETEKTLNEDMKREHPSTPDEAFEQATEGVYFAHQMMRLREEGRLDLYPYQEGFEVHTFWDLGLNDEMAIWFAQKIGGWWIFIDYYENTDYGLDFYIERMFEVRDARHWRFGSHWAPHDMNVRELSNAVTRFQFAKELGVHFEVVAAPEAKDVSIQAARRALSISKIDSEHCEAGVKCMDNYRKQWDKVRACWREKPLHNRASNGADAFQTFALALEKIKHLESRAHARVDPRASLNQPDTVYMTAAGQPRRSLGRSPRAMVL